MPLKPKTATVLLLVVLGLAVFLRFWGLNGVDVQHDAALYSVRALGWFDFLAGQEQPSPIIWFGQIPSWAYLSFHDHPPLVFLIQFLFLNIFGQSSFATLLSFALAGIATTWLLYFTLAKLHSKETGLLAALLFTFSAYSIWINRTGFLEGIEILLITASTAAFLFFLKRNDFRLLFLWAFLTGLALLAKYTALFLLPAAILYLLVWRRDVFKRKEFWLSLILLMVVLLPVIIYNVMVFQTRGHFDAALSSMVGMNPDDYSVLKRRVNFNPLGNIWAVATSFTEMSSLPFALLYLAGLLFCLLTAIKEKTNELKNFTLVNIAMIVAMFAFADASPRFSTILLPFATIVLTLCLYELAIKFANRKQLLTVAAVVLAIIFCYELVYNLNTNILKKPFGAESVLYSRHRFYDVGFNELDRYLKENAYGLLPKKRTVTKLTKETTTYDIVGREMILFDDRPKWNSRMWYVHRYQTYYNVPIVYLTDLINAAGEKNDISQILFQTGATGVWFVIGQGRGIDTTDLSHYNAMIDRLTGDLETQGIEPIQKIYDYNNDVSFDIYHFSLK